MLERRAMRLVIGNKNYSSWSLRPWLVLKQFGIPFEEKLIPLDRDETEGELSQYCPGGKVPTLVDGTYPVWESLAIIDHLQDRFPEKAIWPKKPEWRARARSVSAEMHAGFAALRQHCPMDCRAKKLRPTGARWEAIAEDVARVQDIWTQCLELSGGPFLLGEFSAADAMFAPVVTRFQTYQLPLNASAQNYVSTMLAHPPMQNWLEAARQESWHLPTPD